MTLKISKIVEVIETVPQAKPTTKAKTAAKAKTSVLTQEQMLVDELVMIDLKLKAIDAKTMLERVDAIKKVLQSIAKELPSNEEAIFKGTLGEATFSPCRKDTVVVDKNGLVLALGQEMFNKIATVSLTDLKKYLSENEIVPLVTTGFGSRSLKTVKSYD